jgi:hypothetical protein
MIINRKFIHLPRCTFHFIGRIADNNFTEKSDDAYKTTNFNSTMKPEMVFRACITAVCLLETEDSGICAGTVRPTCTSAHGSLITVQPVPLQLDSQKRKERAIHK